MVDTVVVYTLFPATQIKIVPHLQNCCSCPLVATEMSHLPVQFSTEGLTSVTLPYTVWSTRIALNLQGVPFGLCVFTLMSPNPVWFNIRLYGDRHVLLQGFNWGCKNTFSFHQSENISYVGTGFRDKTRACGFFILDSEVCPRSSCQSLPDE